MISEKPGYCSTNTLDRWVARDIIQPAVRNKDLTAQNIEKRIAGRIAEWLPETKKERKEEQKRQKRGLKKPLTRMSLAV